MQPGPAPILGWPTALAIGLAAGVLLGLAAVYLLHREDRDD